MNAAWETSVKIRSVNDFLLIFLKVWFIWLSEVYTGTEGERASKSSSVTSLSKWLQQLGLELCWTRSFLQGFLTFGEVCGGTRPWGIFHYLPRHITQGLDHKCSIWNTNGYPYGMPAVQAAGGTTCCATVQALILNFRVSFLFLKVPNEETSLFLLLTNCAIFFIFCLTNKFQLQKRKIWQTTYFIIMYDSGGNLFYDVHGIFHGLPSEL